MAVAAPPLHARAGSLAGRTFVHPVYDYLIIGGGLSLVVTALIVATSSRLPFGRIEIAGESILLHHWVLLLCNSAHLAASAVRLYTQPGAFDDRPNLTLVTPLVGLLLVLIALQHADTIGQHAFSLYQTWSPFHYAAQVYGLSVMYCMRSGVRLVGTEKTLLRQACLLPFYLAILQPQYTGIGWLLPTAWLQQPAVVSGVMGLKYALIAAIYVVPLVLYVWLGARRGRQLPLIVPLTMIANGVWWTVMSWHSAFTWATVFHSLQYFSIAAVFHAKDRMALPGNRHGAAYHVAWFYLMSVALGYALLYCVPQGLLFLGYPLSASLLVVIAAVNIHHFVVDAFIWRVSKPGSNRRIVESAG